MFEQKVIDADYFINETSKSGPTMTWVISHDPEKPDFILYYPHVGTQQRCPYVRIHKDRIKSIEPLFPIKCYPAGTPPLPLFNAWAARITLVASSEDDELYGALIALSELSEASKSEGKYECKTCSDTSDEVKLENEMLFENTTETSFAATCTFYCRNGGSITTTGYGSTPAAARSNAEARASIYCSTRGGIGRYGACHSLYP